MADQLVKGKDRMLSGNGELPWHADRTMADGITEIYSGLITAKQIAEKRNLGWNVIKVPVYVDPKAQCVASLVREVRDCNDPIKAAQLQATLAGILSNMPKSVQRVPDSFAILRDDTRDILGVVGSRYEPIQNASGLDILDPVIGDGAAYETAGSLFGGKIVWLLAKVEKEWSVTGSDTFKTYLLVYLSHDGSKPLTVRFVTVRVVCNNTLTAAVHGVKADVTIRHTYNYAGKVEEAHRVLKLADKHQQEFRKVMEKLAAKPMPERAAVKFLSDLFPAKDESDIPTRTQNTRDEVLQLFRTGKGNEGKTRYDMLNGVTEFADHYRGTRLHGLDTKDTSEANARLVQTARAEQRFEATQFGSGARLKVQAFDLLTADIK